MKAKMTRDQVLGIYSHVKSLRDSGIYNLPDFIIDLEPSQIIREKTNVEKWALYLSSWKWRDGVVTLDTVMECVAANLHQLGYNADKAYKEVCGG